MSIDSIVVELIDICNLNCSYCLRDEEALRGRPHALPIQVLTSFLEQARAVTNRCQIQFTGGEPTLHPEFRLALKAVSDIGWRFSIVTNGWAFIPRALPAILEFRQALGVVAFSLDGATRAEHDALRGSGSFDRLMKAVVACRHHDLPFDFKVTFDRPKAEKLHRLALFAARLGARSLQAAPFFPTSMRFAKDVMTVSEQQTFLKEVNQLRSVLRMDVQLTAGFYDPRPEPTCGPLLDQALNLDYHGQLGLCTVLTGFRGQTQNDDLIADLKSETLASALPRLHAVSRQRNEERVRSLNGMGSRAQAPSLALGSPCLSCLLAFGKIQPDLVNSVVEEILMNDDLSFRVSDAIIASEFDGKEGLLLDTSTQRYHSLNETATFLWAAIEAGRTVAEMTDALCQSFEVDGATARSSVERALARLESQSLISRDAKGVV